MKDKRDQAIKIPPPFDFLYGNDGRGPIKSLSEFYKPPKRFPHGDNVLVAVVPKDPPDGDGHTCHVYECRLPATFYMVHVLPDSNSVAEPSKGFCLSTGSGRDMGELVGQIAIAASRGMIGICDPPKEEE